MHMPLSNELIRLPVQEHAEDYSTCLSSRINDLVTGNLDSTEEILLV